MLAVLAMLLLSRGGHAWVAAARGVGSLARKQCARLHAHGASTVVLQRGKARLFRDGELLVYGGAVERVEGKPTAGELVDVTDGAGTLLAYGAYNPDSMFRVRLLWHATDGPAPQRQGGFGSCNRDNIIHSVSTPCEHIYNGSLQSAVFACRRVGL